MAPGETSGGPGKAALRLRRATAAPCRACARETKTVQGVCAECWEPKEPGARVMWHEPKRVPFFDLDVDPIWVYLALAAAAGLLVKLVWALVAAV